jgi:hypothetical protein
MDDPHHYVLDLPSNHVPFKKGQFFDRFFQIISGSIVLTIKHVSIKLSVPMILGDYEILEKI